MKLSIFIVCFVMVLFPIWVLTDIPVCWEGVTAITILCIYADFITWAGK